MTNQMKADTTLDVCFLYKTKNFVNLTTVATHGSFGVLATAADNWLYNSMEKSPTMGLYIRSDFNTVDPLQSYLGHVENFSRETTSFLETKFPSAQYPLEYYCIDKSMATLINISIMNLFVDDESYAIATNSIIPGTQQSFESLILGNDEGSGAAFIGKDEGATVSISLKIGNLDKVKNTIEWNQDAEIVLKLENDNLVVVSQTLPLSWNLSDITTLPDGSFMINVTNGLNGPLCAELYELENYRGQQQPFPYESDYSMIGTVVNQLGEFRISSAKINREHSLGRLMGYSVIESLSPGYSLKNYKSFMTDQDIPDLPSYFGDCNIPCDLVWHADDECDVWIKVATTNTNYSALVSIYADEIYFGSSTNNLYIGHISGGSYTVLYGYLDDNYSFVEVGSGAVTFDVINSVPVVTPLSSSLPSEWSFSSAEKQSDGSWVVTLTD